MPDVIYHEYGHGVTDNLYIQLGSPFGLTNGALHEGLADIQAALMQDTPVMGKGFFGPGTSLRTVDNTLHWPQDASSDPHRTGLIVAGALWDLRESIGLSLATYLAHFAKYGLADDDDDGVAMTEFFIETLVADDTNSNLYDGTPHDAAIASAFNAHGIGTGALLTIAHTPPGDPIGPGPYALVATMGTNSPLGSVAPGSQEIWFSVNGSPYASIAMTPTANPDEYSVALPVPQGTIVRY